MATKPKDEDDKEEVSSESSDVSSDDDDDSLVLEGVLVRNPDVSSSSSSDEDSDQDEEEADSKPAAAAKPAAKQDKASTAASAGDKRKGAADNNNDKTSKKSKTREKNKRKKEQKQQPQVDMVHVDFIFCDMAEKYWGGIKALLSNCASLYQAHSSVLADAMIAHEMVGTVIGTEGDAEHSVYGVASLLHWPHFGTAAQDAFGKVCRQDICRPHKNMPAMADEEATRQGVIEALGKSDNAAAAFLLFGRMINLPLEIVLALHQQLWLDIEFAQKQTEADELSYASASLQTVLRLAPCTREANTTDWVYRYFDDEIMAGQATGKYVVEAPKSFSREDKVYLQVLVLDLKGYQQSIQDLERMVGSGGA